MQYLLFYLLFYMQTEPTLPQPWVVQWWEYSFKPKLLPKLVHLFTLKRKYWFEPIEDEV